jgi:polyvinyl alcohol dehydrogenase (cytochrome)
MDQISEVKRMFRYFFSASAVFAATSIFSASAVAQNSATESNAEVHPGQAVYERNCAMCHNGSDARAHAIETLRSMNADAINHALTEGLMAAQGASLSADERAQVIDYLAAKESEEAWLANNMCADDRRHVDLSKPSLSMFGVDIKSSRNLTAEAAGLTRSQMQDLELAWVMAFPQTTGMRAAPVIAGSTIFYAAGPNRKLIAMDTDTGCVKWVYTSETPLRSSVSLGALGKEGPQALVFGDARGQVHAIDAMSGKPIWVRNGQAKPGEGQITGAVVLHEDKIIVPISASGVGAAANPRHECCSGRGAVTALDAATGEKLWTYFTMEEAEYTGEANSLGVRLRGPSGAPIWSTPSIDSKRGFVYVTTGENTSHPATETSDAIIALDLATGEQKWLFQALKDDVWNMACSTGLQPSGPNCPSQRESVLRDYDFGGAAVLVEGAGRNGGDLLLAGQKSGDLWALNPDDGSLVWNRTVGDGSALGGNHWGIAIDGQRVFHPINDPHFPGLEGYKPQPGMYAFDIRSGEPLWSVATIADCDGRQERAPGCDEKYGLSATPLVVDGAVITAGLDGKIYILEGDTGERLFEYDSAREFESVNGVEAKGGAIDSHSIAAGSGMVFIGSGYGSFRQIPGNVLLAFRPKTE